MGERVPYPSDQSDQAWELIRPVLVAWKDRHRSVSGHQGRYELREIVNAILYQARTGCQWRYLSHDLLRWQVREKAGRTGDPTAVVLATQTVHASTNAPATTTGLDAGKKSRGRKRGIATDVLGLLIAVVVMAANTHDNTLGTALLDKVAAHNRGVSRGRGWMPGSRPRWPNNIDVQVVERDPDTKGFSPLPNRWVVKQILGTLMRHRRMRCA